MINKFEKYFLLARVLGEADGNSMTDIEALRAGVELFKINNPGAPCHLSEQDLRFMEISESMNYSEREKDIIFITSFYHACFIDYNITIKIMKEPVAPAIAERLSKMYKVLEKYNLLDNLFSDRIVVRYDDFLREIL